MNKCIMIGRLCRDVEVRTNNDKSVARFTIAVNRRFKSANGEYEADFISCTAFGATADFINKYFAKGSPIGIVGRWATGSYTNNEGAKVYTNELIVEEAEFVGSRSEQTEPKDSEGGETPPNLDTLTLNDDDLPF